MNKKNAKKLFNECKFLRPKGGLKQSSMYFGFEIDDGWYKLIYQLCKGIQRVIDNTPDESLKGFQVLQVKEKFGGLRFYVSGYSKEIGDLIDNAERKSYQLCEICGKRGSISVKGGWYKTLCPYHRRTRGFRKMRSWLKAQ